MEETPSADNPSTPEGGEVGSSLAIFLAMALGVAWGSIARTSFGGEIYVGFLGSTFKAILKMLIMPLVFCSIFTGITSLGDLRQLGRLGTRTLGLYALTTGLAVALGLFVVNTTKPGVGTNADQLQVSLEVQQGKHLRLLELARADAEAQRTESARWMYQLFLDRYGKRVEDRALLHTIESERNQLPEIPPERQEKRQKEAQTRWNAELGLGRSPMKVSDFLHAQIGKLFKNPFQALAGGDILAVIVFALMFGISVTTLGPRSKTLIEVASASNDAMMVMTDWIMRVIAPVGVFALMADVVSALGIDVLRSLAGYMVAVLLGLGFHGFVILPALLWMVARVSPVRFFQGSRKALAISFSTASSSATLPVSMELAEKELDCSAKVAGFVLPLGATVNMDGTALYEAVAALFIAQLYGIPLSLSMQVLVALTATLAAVGAAGIPSAGTVTMVMVLNAAGLPLDGIALILAVDRILDMCRTSVNVIGDLSVAVMVDRLEKADDAASPEG